MKRERKIPVLTSLGFLGTAYQAGKVGYGNFPWIDNVKENPIQPFQNLVGYSSGGFNFATLLDTDLPAAVGIVADKALKWAGINVSFGKRFKL